jgi:A/G-specific adenine glycosylase
MPNTLMRKKKVKSFQDTIWKFYKENGRKHLPWRKTKDPYKILVSEIMLQQTQADRVIPKYISFLKRFPTVKSLAKSKNKDLLQEWQGLGYNRRALNLKRTAEIIHATTFPKTYEELLKLPGVGPATAGDIVAFAYNKPAVVIETNIRTVFIYHFFPTQDKVSDKELFLLVKETVDSKNPREWYYALMDYGAYLKKTFGNNIQKSVHYKKQSSFKGSNRELRSHILKLVLEKPRTQKEIEKLVTSSNETIVKNLNALEKEGLIKNKNKKFVC